MTQIHEEEDFFSKTFFFFPILIFNSKKFQTKCWQVTFRVYIYGIVQADSINKWRL